MIIDPTIFLDLIHGKENFSFLRSFAKKDMSHIPKSRSIQNIIGSRKLFVHIFKFSIYFRFIQLLGPFYVLWNEKLNIWRMWILQKIWCPVFMHDFRAFWKALENSRCVFTVTKVATRWIDWLPQKKNKVKLNYECWIEATDGSKNVTRQFFLHFFCCYVLLVFFARFFVDTFFMSGSFMTYCKAQKTKLWKAIW